MPVGVPYVEYLLPGNPEPEWINMYNALYRERMLFLCQELEDTISNELIGLMLYLNAEDPSRALFLYINSPGGSVTCGIGIYDIMRYLNSGITTICMGTASSMASFILAGGTYGRRIALPNSRIMIHQPEGGSDGQATEIVSESTEVARIRRQVGLIYANRTQQSIERIAQDLDRDQFMSAYDAKEYGLIDFVARSQKEEYVPGYDLLGTTTFKIPAFLQKLTLESVPPGDDAFHDLPSELALYRNAQSAVADLDAPRGAGGKSTLGTVLPLLFPSPVAETQDQSMGTSEEFCEESPPPNLSANTTNLPSLSWQPESEVDDSVGRGKVTTREDLGLRLLSTQLVPLEPDELTASLLVGGADPSVVSEDPLDDAQANAAAEEGTATAIDLDSARDADLCLNVELSDIVTNKNMTMEPAAEADEGLKSVPVTS